MRNLDGSRTPNMTTIMLKAEKYWPAPPIYKRSFVSCIQCQGTGLVARLGGTPLTCECSAVKFK